MSWYELLLTLHVLAAALWFGSGLTLTIIALRMLATDPPGFGALGPQIQAWAGRAHPAAAGVILLAGFGMVIDADLSLGEPWIVIALIGWVALAGLGGGLLTPAGERLTAAYTRAGGVVTDEVRTVADRLLLLMRIETAILVLVIADMVAKPG